MTLFRIRIAAWVVLSCTILIAVMILTAHRHLEEELRQGQKDPTHPHYESWKIHNSYSEAEIEDILGEMLEKWLQVGATMILISLGAGLLLARRSLRPVHDINRQIGAMRPDSLRGGIVIPEADPMFADLVSHLNSLLDRAGTAYQEMADFSAKVGHEMRTPLMLLRLRVEHAPEGVPPAFQEELQDELSRLSRFVERALLAAKAEQGGLQTAAQPMDLSSLVHELAENYQLLATERSLHMEITIEDGLPIHADPDLLRQALHGLLENAMRYARSEVSIGCHQSSGGVPVLKITNDVDPAGISAAGLGLGIRLVRGICKVSGFGLLIQESDGIHLVEIRFATGGEISAPHPQTVLQRAAPR